MVAVVPYTARGPYTCSSAGTISAEVSAQERHLILLGMSFNDAAKSTLRSHQAIARLGYRITSRAVAGSGRPAILTG
jgi:hypothetical protein